MISEPTERDLTIIRGITFGPVTIVCRDQPEADGGLPVDLTDYIPYAAVRRKPGGELLELDLAPQVTDTAGGEVTIPAIQDEDTELLEPFRGGWDFILELPNGERRGPFVTGKFVIRDKYTDPGS